MPFSDSDTVTPLPCDKRHYFHSRCIEEWSKTCSDCPLCKKPFNAQILAQAINNRSSVTGVPPPNINGSDLESQQPLLPQN